KGFSIQSAMAHRCCGRPLHASGSVLCQGIHGIAGVFELAPRMHNHRGKLVVRLVELVGHMGGSAVSLAVLCTVIPDGMTDRNNRDFIPLLIFYPDDFAAFGRI